MQKAEDHKSLISDKLLKQIEKLCTLVQEIQGETEVIVKKDNVSNANAHLQNVVKSTEEATYTIIDAVAAIQAIADISQCSPKDKKLIGEHVTRVYEACNFQDITGQRIKKVLNGLESLHESIIKLAEKAKGNNVASASSQSTETPSTLLDGPQLSHEALRQEDVDQLLSSYAANGVCPQCGRPLT